MLDGTTSEKALEKLAEGLWNLCLWERQRTTALDTKAAALTNLSSLAAAVIAASTVVGVSATPSSFVPLPRLIAAALFVVTVLLSLNTQRVTLLGGFLDVELFQALMCHTKPVGITPPFSDKDEYRCFLREIALQRWVVYRRNCNENDSKYRRLGLAQSSAAVAVLSLILVLIKSVL
jgi:hypothetical protein